MTKEMRIKILIILQLKGLISVQMHAIELAYLYPTIPVINFWYLNDGGCICQLQ